MKEIIDPSIIPAKFRAEGLGLLTTRSVDMPDGFVLQLVDKSLQPHVHAFEGLEDVGNESTPGRFRSLEDYREWAEGKERMIYLMIREGTNPDGLNVPDIGGIIWFGQRENRHAPGRDITFAIRNYIGCVGRGLGGPFMQAAHAHARQTYPNKRIWLDLVDGNEPALNLYRHNGYQELKRFEDESHGGQKRILMANDTAFKVDQLVHA